MLHLHINHTIQAWDYEQNFSGRDNDTDEINWQRGHFSCLRRSVKIHLLSCWREVLNPRIPHNLSATLPSYFIKGIVILMSGEDKVSCTIFPPNLSVCGSHKIRRHIAQWMEAQIRHKTNSHCCKRDTIVLDCLQATRSTHHIVIQCTGGDGCLFDFRSTLYILAYIYIYVYMCVCVLYMSYDILCIWSG